MFGHPYLRLCGFVVLLIGHVGWYRESDRESDAVSKSLFIGSFLATWPLASATWHDRCQGEFRMVNEFGFLFESVLILAAGSIFRLKSASLIGGLKTALYFLTLLIRVLLGQLNSIAVAFSVGGATLFDLRSNLAFFAIVCFRCQIKSRRDKGCFEFSSGGMPFLEAV